MPSEDKHPSTTHHRPEIDAQRRRFAKGGLAAPVVIGSLLSRPVLGAAPHNCTISGQISGNVSTHLQGDCTQLGLSHGYWKNRAWSDFVRGSVSDSGQGLKIDPNNPAPPGDPQLVGTLFRNLSQGGSSFADVYRRKYNSKNKKWVRVDPDDLDFYSATPMTALEVLNLGDGMASAPYPGLGREAVGALLNAIDPLYRANFPLTAVEVINMFNATVNGSSYEVATDVYWKAADVRDYFASLHSKP